jgi:hypothetical protein
MIDPSGCRCHKASNEMITSVTALESASQKNPSTLADILRSDCPARIRSSGKRLKRISTSEFSKRLNGQQSPKSPSLSGLSGFEEGEAENSTDNLRNQSQSTRSVHHRFLLDVSEAKHLRLTHFALGFSCHTPKAKDIATPRRAALPAIDRRLLQIC